MTTEKPGDEYERQTQRWVRDSPQTLGDFMARARAAQIVSQIGKGKSVWDNGCGEGFVSRLIAPFVGQVTGTDISQSMIRQAITREGDYRTNSKRIFYWIQDSRKIQFPEEIFDVAMSNFVYSYFTPGQLKDFYAETARVLVPGGKFVFSGVHPVFYFSQDSGAYEIQGKGPFDYHKSRGKWFKGKIKMIDGQSRDVSTCHSTLEDHFSAIEQAGLAVTRLEEPIVPAELGKKYQMFKKSVGTSPYMILVGEKRIKN